ncbi:MAG TPA: response regulator [Terriglobales bacterium]|nr:response regulator [Terriglobales bacterium]
MPLKILLADDSMTAQKMGLKILVDAGHEVIAVSNGAAAVKKIASEKPNLIVLDVYMPGYTGLEVCERVRASQETAKIPVLLTLGKMETGAFKPEDATRVKADGVIIKPFEATDLLAAVKKIEEKLAAPAPEEAKDYETTVKLNTAEMFKQDSSYQEWQVAAPEHKDEEPEEAPAKAKLEVPTDMAGAAAFGDMLGDEPVEARAAALEAAAGAAATPTQYATAPSVSVEPVAPPMAGEPAGIALDFAPNTQKYEAPASAPPSKDPEVEPTSGWGAAKVEHATDPHFEPTVSQEKIDVSAHAKDPALVTDAAEMASAFVTKFGVDNPEPVVVGVAAEAGIDGLYADGAAPAEAANDEQVTADVTESVARMKEAEAAAKQAEAATPAADDEFEKRVAAAMSSGYQEPAGASVTVEVPAPVAEAAPAAVEAAPAAAEAAPAAVEAAPAAVEAAPAAPSWAAQEASVAEHEATMSLDQEMLKAFSAAVPPDPEPLAPAPEPVAVAQPEPAPAPAPVNAPDLELAKEMAKAVAPDAGPGTIAMAAAAAASATGGSIDPARLAEAIHRALDKLKPELIAHIAKELDQK